MTMRAGVRAANRSKRLKMGYGMHQWVKPHRISGSSYRVREYVVTQMFWDHACPILHCDALQESMSCDSLVASRHVLSTDDKRIGRRSELCLVKIAQITNRW